MPKSRISSPACSQGVISTPRKQLRRTVSVGSPARTNLRLSTIIDSYKVSPLPSRQSVLNDDTDIDIPRRGSWWKKIGDNSRDVSELLQNKEIVEINNVSEEFDVEVLSQENKNYALDLPESSDGESINSIVIPQRKLFTQKENQPQIQFGQVKNNRETLQKLNKSYVDQDKELNIGRKTLFSQPSKPRTKPVFPAALLNISANKTANKSKEITAAGVQGQVRSLFGSRPGAKRKNMFADFIASESEDEISVIQPKVFAFQKRNEQKRRASSMSRHSPTSSIDLEMDDWRLLPSSTMVENQIDEATSPVKRIKLSNLLETNSEENTNSNNTLNKIKQANKSISSKSKSKNSSNIIHEDDKNNDIHLTTPTKTTTNNSRVTRSMGRSLRENSVTSTNISKNLNKSKNQTHNNHNSNDLKTGKTIKNASQRDSGKDQEKQSVLIEHPDPDENLTLEYDNDNNEVVPDIRASLKKCSESHKDKTTSNLNVDAIVDKSNLIKESSGMKNKENLVEHEISTNKIRENDENLSENTQNDIKSIKASNYSNIQNNSQEIGNVVGLIKDSSNLNQLNKSIEKNKRKSIMNYEENYNEHSISKHMQKEKSCQERSVNRHSEKNETLGKSSENLSEENREDQEMESEKGQNYNSYEQHLDIDEEANESTQLEENNDSESEKEMDEDEHQENESQTENASEKESIIEEREVINENNTNESDKEIILDDQRDNVEDKIQVTLPNVSHNTTGRHRKETKSPEVILHDKTKRIDSFTVQAKNTSVRKTKSIIFHNKLDTDTDFRRSTGFSDGTGNSSAEGSGWDSHRTTRKTLRQTFGKDFTPRKSLRALVMEKTAKLQANYTEIVENTKIPLVNSTEFDKVQDELDSYQETDLVQVEQNIKMIQGDKRVRREAIQLENVHIRDVTERIEERDKTEKLKEKEKNEQLDERNERNEADQSKCVEKVNTELSKLRAETEQPDERDKTKQVEEREEVEEAEEREDLEESEEREDVEESKEREVMKESEEREEMEDSEEGEEMEYSEEREEMEESAEREEIEESVGREEMEESEEREEIEESVGREEMEESEEREEMEESEEREEIEESEGGEEMEESEEREEIEESEGGEEMEESEEREEMEDSEEKEEMEEFADREKMEESEEREEMDDSEETEEMEESEEREVEQSKEGEEIEQSENETRYEQFGERDETDQSEDETEQFEERDETVPDDEIIAEVSNHEVSKQSRQTSLETYLHKIKQDNAEKRRKMQEDLRNSLKNPKRDAFNLFKVPQKPVRRTIKSQNQKPKAKQIKSVIPLEMLPSEIIEDMKYKPPKRFQPNNASWITKRLYKFLENKLEPKYDYKARIRAEKLVQGIYNFTKEVRRHDSVRSEGIEELKREMARLDIVQTHFDFYEFFHEFLPREIRIKVIPDIVNNIQLPRHGVFSDILR